MFNCDKCIKKYTTHTALTKHKMSIHDEFIQITSNSKYKYICNLYKNIESGLCFYKCHHCCKFYDTCEKCENHMKIVHTYHCINCPETFKNMCLLDEHEKKCDV